MKNCNMAISVVCGCLVGFFSAKAFCSDATLQSDKEVATMCQKLMLIGQQHPNNELMGAYFSEIARGVTDYYNSKSSRRMNNQIIVKWNEALIENENHGLTYSTEANEKGSVIVNVWDGKTGRLLQEVDTRASCYKHFGLYWISADCILMNSSDIGSVMIAIQNGGVYVKWGD